MNADEKKRKAIREKLRGKVKNKEWAYNGSYDAYYDVKTRKWVERKCGNKTCEFCSKRPRLAPVRTLGGRGA